MTLLPTKSLKPSDILFKDLRELIIEARQDVARSVNSALVMLYWRVGKRIRQDVLKERRAEYGEEIVPTLSAQLSEEFGTGFNEKNLRRMIQFAEAFPLTKDGMGYFRVMINEKLGCRLCTIHSFQLLFSNWVIRSLRGYRLRDVVKLFKNRSSENHSHP